MTKCEQLREQPRSFYRERNNSHVCGKHLQFYTRRAHMHRHKKRHTNTYIKKNIGYAHMDRDVKTIVWEDVERQEFSREEGHCQGGCA